MRISDWSSDVCSSDLLGWRKQWPITVPSNPRLQYIPGEYPLGARHGRCGTIEVGGRSQVPQSVLPLVFVAHVWSDSDYGSPLDHVSHSGGRSGVESPRGFSFHIPVTFTQFGHLLL